MVKQNVKVPQEKHIQVVVRCRPINGTEKKQGAYKVVDTNFAKKEMSVNMGLAEKSVNKTFSFDKVYGPKAKQIELYRGVVEPILDEVLTGYNCTVFAYGQTGTGKTFTMEGERTPDNGLSWEEDPLAGVIPRAMHQIFDKLNEQDIEFSLRVSYLELYNEELFDLLAPTDDAQRLRIFEDSARKGSVVIQGLEEVIVHSKDEVYNILARGSAKRQTAATLMNSHSSRSHSVFSVTIHIKENSIDGEELLKTGKLNLVDLAGSENIGRSGAVDKRAREAGNINQSLLTLGRVITALVEHAPHIPYRESKLTRLLQDSLGGRTKTSIIATISEGSINLEETLSTLDYAHRAKNITNRPEINQKLTKRSLIKEYTEEIERLRRDVLAAREKNGIYLSEENYRTMETTIATQVDTIKEKMEKLVALTEELKKVEEMFTFTQRELEETSEQLDETTKTLNSTKSTLTKTKKVLKQTTQNCCEQKHLVTKHVATEKSLYSQATTLLDVVGGSTRDVSGLHAKLDRKHLVEKHNSNAQTCFQDNFQAQMESLHGSLTSFSEKQVQYIEDHRGKLENNLQGQSEEVNTLCSSLTTIVDDIERKLNTIATTNHEQCSASKQWTDEMISVAQQQKVKNESSLQTLFEDTIIPRMRNIQDQLTAHSQAMNEWKQQLKAQCDSQTSHVKDFFAEESVKLNDLASLANRQMQTHVTNLEKQQEAAQELVHETEKQGQDFMTMITEHMKSMLSQQNSSLQTRVDALKTQQNEVINEVQEFDREVKKSVACIGTAKEEFADLFNSETHAFTEQMATTIEHACGKQAETEKIRCGVENVFAGFTNKEVVKFDQHNIELKDKLESRMKAVEKETDDCTQDVNEVKTELQEQMALTSHTIQNQQKILHNTVTSWKRTLLNQSEDLESWSEGMAEEFNVTSQMAENFVTSDIKDDVPTGTTPQRRNFHYPRILSKTDPHAKILKHFRVDCDIKEATSLPLPDDSEIMVNKSLETSGDLSLSSIKELSLLDSNENDASLHIQEQGESECKENFVIPVNTTSVSTRKVHHSKVRTPSSKSRLPLRSTSNTSSNQI